MTATGYSVAPTIKFVPETIHADLGIPSRSFTDLQTKFWAYLDGGADVEISGKLPFLFLGPPRPSRAPSTAIFDRGTTDQENIYTPFRLYRSIAPPGLTVENERSIVFIGYFGNIAATVRLELTCLWAYAYLFGKLNIDKSTVYEDTALFSRFNKYRSPYGHGRSFPDVVFDQNPFFDLLLQDLGLPYWRKKNLFREIFEAYGQDDYRGLTKEWLQKNRLTS